MNYQFMGDQLKEESHRPFYKNTQGSITDMFLRWSGIVTFCERRKGPGILIYKVMSDGLRTTIKRRNTLSP